MIRFYRGNCNCCLLLEAHLTPLRSGTLAQTDSSTSARVFFGLNYDVSSGFASKLKHDPWPPELLFYPGLLDV